MSILHTQRAGIEYVEHCAIRAADERLVFVKKKDAVEMHFSIPNLNTAVLLLGPGTSLTQPAAKLCAEAKILVAFAGGGASPLYLAALDEYREPSYSRRWIAMWGVEPERLKAAKNFQLARTALIAKCWARLDGIEANPGAAIADFEKALPAIACTTELLACEADMTKRLYAELARACGKPFVRRQKGKDFANEYLDMGNYLAYGLAACALWVLGIPFSYPLVHGKTRRGALVFDVADIVKDALVMPNAFIAATLGEPENVARSRILGALHDANALKLMFQTILAQIPERESAEAPAAA